MKINNTSPHAVFLDIDGTIVPYLSEGPVSDRLRIAITEAQKKGHLFFINTGRARGYVPQKIVASAPFDGLVCGLGAYVEYHEKIIYHAPLGRPIIEKIADYCVKNGENCIFEGLYDGCDGRYAIGDSGFFDVKKTFSDKDSLISAIKDTEITKLTVCGIPCDEYKAFLEEMLDIVYIVPKYAEGALYGHNKGSGIHRVCDILGIPKENTIAVGDSENDIAMLRSAALSVGMGNSCDTIRPLCDMFTDTVENDGAAKIIEELFLK